MSSDPHQTQISAVKETGTKRNALEKHEQFNKLIFQILDMEGELDSKLYKTFHEKMQTKKMQLESLWRSIDEMGSTLIGYLKVDENERANYFQEWRRIATLGLEIQGELRKNSPKPNYHGMKDRQAAALVEYTKSQKQNGFQNSKSNIEKQWFPKLNAFRTTESYWYGTKYKWSCCEIKSKHHIVVHFSVNDVGNSKDEVEKKKD